MIFKGVKSIFDISKKENKINLLGISIGKNFSKKFLFPFLRISQSNENSLSYGEIHAEWHDGSPDWAFGPPA